MGYYKSLPRWQSSELSYTYTINGVPQPSSYPSVYISNNNYLYIGNNVKYLTNLLYHPDGGSRYDYNKEILIPDEAIDCRYMFQQATFFSQEVLVPKNVKICTGMFQNAVRFDAPVYFLGSDRALEFADSVFFNCQNLNSPIIFNNNFLNCNTTNSMFWNCVNFNQPLNFRLNTLDASYMFYNCLSLSNVSLNISNYANPYQMFWYCNNIYGNIVIRLNTKLSSFPLHYFFDPVNRVPTRVLNFYCDTPAFENLNRYINVLRISVINEGARFYNNYYNFCVMDLNYYSPPI